MRYMMLIHHDDTILADALQKELWAEYMAFNEALAKAGGSTGLRLQSADAATSVRMRNGETDVIDGPYADTKEQLAGYFVVQAEDLDGAIAWAQRCPSSRFGTVEIRPVVEQQG